MALAAVGKGDAAAHLRPTTDRVRESLFNTLMGGRYGDPISDTRVLDLFAGTGALGLEAWSRGADRVTFVDDGRVAQGLIRANIDKARAADDTRLIGRNALKLGPNAEAGYDLIFLDPPYGKGLGDRALAVAIAQGWVGAGALVVCEDSAEPQAPPQFERIETRRYGDTHVGFLRAPD